MWNGSIRLPIKKTEIINKNGIVQNTGYEFSEEIPANFTDTTRNDEILAFQNGYTADQNVEIMACNYNGQSFLIDEATGQQYDIRRTHRNDKSMKMVLTCERRERGKDGGNHGTDRDHGI